MAPRRQDSGTGASSRDATPGLDHAVHGPDPMVERLVRKILDPALIPLGFAPAQMGHEQAIFCRGLIHSTDGECVDLVLDLGASPTWHITDVRYWGFPSERWHLEVRREAALPDQLTELAGTLPGALSDESAR